MILKILSWNVWVDGDFDKTSAFLKKTNADIIGLQEVRDNDEKRDYITFLSKLGYGCAFTRVNFAGPAVFSKYPIVNSYSYSLSTADRRVATRADIKIGKTTLHTFSAHILHTHQRPSVIQDEQVDSLIKLFPESRVILMGDFNARPASNVIKKINKVLRNVDSENKQMSWSVHPDGCRVCNPKGALNERLDYIFVSKDMETEAFLIGKNSGSDHLPLLATIKL